MNCNKILVYFYGAFSPAFDGCHARVCSLLDRLSATSNKVAVYSYDNHPDFPWTSANVDAFRERWPKVELILERYSASLKYLTRLKNLAISVFPSAADRLLRISIPWASPALKRLREESCIVFVNYAHGLSQLNGIYPERCLIDTHDINFAKWAKMSGSSSVSTTSLRKLRGEIAVLRTSAAVVAISPAEAAFFRMMLSGEKVFYVATWDIPGIGAKARDELVPDIDLVFVGSAYIMNARGLCGLLETHGNWLSRYRIAVCGLVCSDPDVIAMAARFPNISLLGYVERLAGIYARSRAALSPVDGTGLKMKIVAALQAGVPAFASKQTMDGLPPGYENCVFSISESNVSEFLSSESRIVAARAAALDYYATFDQAGDTVALLNCLNASR